VIRDVHRGGDVAAMNVTELRGRGPSKGTTRCNGTRWWTDASRVGEASTPGPLAATIMAEGMLRKAYATARSALCYPMPGANSLKRTIAPGFPASVAGVGDEEDFALEVESVNATGWRALQRRLLGSSAHAVLAQETWLTQDAIPAASAWARRNGWQSIWTAAVPGPNGGASGGAAVLVRTGFGLRYPPCGSHEWWPGRVVAAVADVPGHRPLLLVSTYLIAGTGPSEGNLEVLAKIGQRLEAMEDKHELVMGGTSTWSPQSSRRRGLNKKLARSPCIPRL
jgi:hypothetical protein